MRQFAAVSIALFLAAIVVCLFPHSPFVIPVAILSSTVAVVNAAILLRLLPQGPPPPDPTISLKRDLDTMQTRVDLLSAEREVSLVLNQDVDFKVILQKVLEITADLIGGRSDDEIVIFLKDDQDGHLVPRAARRRGETLFDEIGSDGGDPTITASLAHGRQMLTSDNDFLDVAIPLTADREIIGVMKIRTALEGDNDERGRRIERLTQAFDEFSKFISLAVKTPDLYTRAVEDGLTKLATKRHFLTQLALAVDGARRYQDPLSLIMIDIDHFKKINDTHGHQTGDIVLKGVADVLLKSLRKAGDTAFSGYRYGGEELSIILPKTPADKASLVAERLRKQVETKVFKSDRDQPIKVTISAGVAQFAPPMNVGEDLVASADKSLYLAKQSGRNRVTVSDSQP